ncbi:Lrp/AsnC family transcriptional regulator [Mucilaginibacter sp. SP1R1]|uniref:Lrp/AsnC family transcriptional regulator n=1 Tax=Mucilaginibacter sp. SP1R1 TaxID=2723091 RepID=UPI0016123990|nr:Lrp/AsnC family transcriptional regulator [Mucilaginibacter sp. SP1R1]MBB6152627.1 Lrp/AsnC family leucine-responsive transcriptional regulator [Mucilaginibacter sp. SP1R1]
MFSSLDSTDISILKLLQENARFTNKEIAEKLNKTATPIFRRIKRLEEEGYIKNYVAVLDPKKIDRGLMAFTHVQVKDHSKGSLKIFEKAIIQLPEVLECYHMSGVYDFILRVAVRDLEAYHNFLMNRLFNIIEVGSVQSTFVMKECKHEAAFPIAVPANPFPSARSLD